MKRVNTVYKTQNVGNFAILSAGKQSPFDKRHLDTKLWTTFHNRYTLPLQEAKKPAGAVFKV